MAFVCGFYQQGRRHAQPISILFHWNRLRGGNPAERLNILAVCISFQAHDLDRLSSCVWVDRVLCSTPWGHILWKVFEIRKTMSKLCFVHPFTCYTPWVEPIKSTSSKITEVIWEMHLVPFLFFSSGRGQPLSLVEPNWSASSQSTCVCFGINIY